jgi:hypothetical protein
MAAVATQEHFEKYPFSSRNSKLSGLLQFFLHHEIGEIWDFPKCPNVNA